MTKALMFLGMAFVSASSFAEDSLIVERLKKRGGKIEYVYHPKWIVLYAFDSKERVTTVNNPHNWKVPHLNCILGPVRNSPPEKFSRNVICDDKNLGVLDCVAKGEKTSCEKAFGKINVVLRIKRFPTMGTRRAIEVERERTNKIPY